MDLAKVLAQLRSDLANLNAAIDSLERLQETERRRGPRPRGPAPVKRRGRPPGKRGPSGSDKRK